MRNAVFVLGSFTFAVLLLAACMVSGSRGAVNEIVVPTVILARIAASPTETPVVASATTIPTSAPTVTIFLSPTGTAPVAPTETAGVPSTPTPIGFHLSGYPDPGTPTPIPPSPTPALSANGQWEILTVGRGRFELPADWYNQPWEGWYANFPLPTEYGFASIEELDRGLIRTEYRDDIYYHYTGYQFDGLEPLMVGGYPAYQWRGFNELGYRWNFILIVEGPESTFFFSEYALLHSDMTEAQKTTFYERGEQVFNHLIDTFEVVDTEPPDISATGTVELTATVEKVDTMARLVYLVPSDEYPYREIRVPVYRTQFSYVEGRGDLLLEDMGMGMKITVSGVPLSETQLRGYSITVLNNE